MRQQVTCDIGSPVAQCSKNSQLEDMAVQFMLGFYAFALDRAETSACHLAMLRHSGGVASFAGFMKSMATRAVYRRPNNVRRRRTDWFRAGGRESAGTRPPEACWPLPMWRVGEPRGISWPDAGGERPEIPEKTGAARLGDSTFRPSPVQRRRCRTSVVRDLGPRNSGKSRSIRRSRCRHRASALAPAATG